MLSAYLIALGVGAVGLGLGLLVQGPLALDRRTTRTRSDSAYVDGNDALDLHADRQLGRLDGSADEVWRPLTSLHCWTIGAVAFGLLGIGLTAAGAPSRVGLGTAIALGLATGYAGAWGLRGLPARSDG